MNDQPASDKPLSSAPRPVSVLRIAAVVVPLVVLAFVLRNAVDDYYIGNAERRLERDVLTRLLGSSMADPPEAIDFQDADSDLVADPPADDQCVTPEKLIFSHIARPDSEQFADDWTDVLAAISDKTGLPVEYAPFTTLNDQIVAMAKGELHIASFNTGSTARAVRVAGFVPVCTYGDDAGGFGYKMQIIAPAKGPMKTIEDLRGQTLTFVRPDSNSGCKAALVLLMNEYGMLPETGYQYVFSVNHTASILGVASGEMQAASIASDIFESMAARGEVDPASVRVVYESERFPPASLGYAYNLAPELREEITAALVEFEWAGSSIEGKYGGDNATRFVPVNFKDDWANIRRVDDSVEQARKR